METFLTRDPVPTPGHTYGQFRVGDLIVETIERPWIPAADHPGGTNLISCVPVGRYSLVLHDTVDHPQTWALVNHELGVYHHRSEIPPAGGRSEVLIHPANWAKELEGCIAPGLSRSIGDGLPMVIRSVPAFTKIKAALPWTDGHFLTII